MTATELDAVHNPLERFTLRLVQNVLGEDHRRVRRHLGAPILIHRSDAVDYGALESVVDQRDREDESWLVARDGRRMLGKPFRSAVRDTTFIRGIELALDDIKMSTLLSDSFDDGSTGRRFGRLSIHLRTDHPLDPVEVTYINRGWRIGSGAEVFKVGYSVPVTAAVNLAVRTRYNYADQRVGVWGDLWWRFSRITQMHVLAGDHVDLVTGTALYPLVYSPFVLDSVDESLGVMAYVEHLF